MKRKILSSFLALSFILSMMSSIAFAANTNTSQLKYTDVQNHWAQTAIEKWSNLGIIQGYNGSFRPDDSITRGEMAVIIDRIMQYKTSANNSFSDLGQAFYTASILKANAAGVILGDKKTIRPIAARKPAVSNDLFQSKPVGGYAIDTLKPAFDEIVATRLVFQNSMDLVNAATAADPLKDISYVTMLITNLDGVTHYTMHSGIAIATKKADLQNLVTRYNALSADKQAAALLEVSSKDYLSSNQTLNALDAALTTQGLK